MLVKTRKGKEKRRRRGIRTSKEIFWNLLILADFYSTMESLVSQSRNLCPFLHRTSPATLRTLSTATRPAYSPGGGTISNLQVIARRCPVMSKALAVQGSRMGNVVGQKFGGNCSLRSGRYSQKRGYHSSGKKEAHVDPQFHRKGEFRCYIQQQQHKSYTTPHDS